MKEKRLEKIRFTDSEYSCNDQSYYYSHKYLPWLDGISQNRYTEFEDNVRREFEKMRREDILKRHGFKISVVIEHRKGGDRQRFRTFLPDQNGKKGKQIVKATEEELKDAIAEYYLQMHPEDAAPTFKDIYEEWCEYYFKLNNSSPNTINKYHNDYDRFLKDSSFEKMPITDIRDTDIEEFFVNCIKSYTGLHGKNGLEYKAFGRLYGYLKGTFRRAYKRRIIDENPMDYLDKSDFKSVCRVPEEKTAETELIPDKEFSMILEQLYKDMEEQPTYFAPYAVELAALTGMRVAELATLKWEDIDYNAGYITIRRSDKDNRVRDENGKITHNWIVAETKTKKKRRFPIDVYIKRSLERIRRAQLEHNVASEWVFPHEQYGWTRSSIISSCLKNKCIQLGLDRTYGIHAFRKTLNSDMRMDNAPAKMCASMLGNTPEVNDQHYYYDTSKMDEKLTYVESAHKKRSFA